MVSEEKLKDVLEETESVAAAEAAMEGEAAAEDAAKELREAREELAALRDRVLRMAAESENFKKRMERERIAGLKYAGEAIFREMLPVVDNLERAIAQGIVSGAEAEKNLAALLAGVQLVLKSLLSTLEKFEVKPVESVGQPFDPQKQEALTMEASDTVPANHVILEYEKGYYYKDRLLRAAKVVVSSGAAAASPGK